MPLISLDQSQLDSIIASINARPKTNLLYEYTVTSSAVTSIVIPSLDIMFHDSYRIEIELFNATATAFSFFLYANGDTLASNYSTQMNLTTGTSTTSAVVANALFGYCDSSSRSLTVATLSLLTGGFLRWLSSCSRGTMSLPSMSSMSGIKKASIPNLTQLTLTSSVANSIGIGSTIRIYRGDY